MSFMHLLYFSELQDSAAQNGMYFQQPQNGAAQNEGKRRSGYPRLSKRTFSLRAPYSFPSSPPIKKLLVCQTAQSVTNSVKCDNSSLVRKPVRQFVHKCDSQDAVRRWPRESKDSKEHHHLMIASCSSLSGVLYSSNDLYNQEFVRSVVYQGAATLRRHIRGLHDLA